ncbi:MAG: hypothetical protein HQK51_09410 [Oligoflexia bacterium]|nr:hypothetical protein [Oligoflexia bacterium]
MKICISNIDQNNIQNARYYLNTHEDTSQFLINNYYEHGPILTAHNNSGNFKIIHDEEKIVGVFCLARRGNLLVQMDGDFSEIILNSCKHEPINLRGFIGDWCSIKPIWKRFKESNPDYVPSIESKEILYSYELHSYDKKLKHDSHVRLMQKSDFKQTPNSFNKAKAFK